MCGICGIVGPSALQSESPGVVEKMMALLAHRGPDGEGLVTGTNFIFGHKRLEISPSSSTVKSITTWN